MKDQVKNILAYLSKKIIEKHNPKIIGITGSVGKTSAKEAVFNVVSQKFLTRKSEKNFNSEFGLTYAIIGVKQDPQKNIFSWFKLFISAINQAYLSSKYPKVLVLEMGVDHPGDMDYLFSIAKPDIGVLTSISFAHYEFFESEDEIAKEKGKIAEILKPEGYFIVNSDNQKCVEQTKKTSAKVLSYGLNKEALVTIASLQENFSEKIYSKVEIKTPTKNYSAEIRVVGETHLSAILCAAAVAEIMHIETDLITRGMLLYKPQGGRLNYINGIKHSVIIDDSYNASPDSVLKALERLEKTPGKKKIAALGDMLELGSITEEKHIEVGKKVAAMKVNKLITVGIRAAFIAQAAKDAGMSESDILSFDSSSEARKHVSQLLEPETVILVKGSQGVRMEKITKEIMAEPARAEELLCRQYGHWLED